MQIAAHVLAYNVNRFIEPVLKNLEPHVDKIYVAYAEKPWGYVESSRNKTVNPTTISDIQLASNSDKIEIVQGDWLTEEDMRNECLKRARNDGFDWLLVQDADEFYTNSTWEQIKNNLLHNKSDNSLKTTWYNFWKSSEYVLMYSNGSIKHTNANFAMRCASDVTFMRKRLPNVNSVAMDCPCYHYGYVMSDVEMLEKVSTWGHANEIFANSWFKYKWQNWSESTKYLHPVLPASWDRAIRFPLEQPDFAQQFALPLHTPNQSNLRDIIGDNYYNTKVHAYETKKSIKKIVKALIANPS